MEIFKASEFKYFPCLPYDIRRQVWLYLIPSDNWKLERHAECLRDLLSGKDYGSLARFKEEYPSPWLSLAASPESRRIAFELLKKKVDQLEERSMKGTSPKDGTVEAYGSSALSINVRGHLMFSVDDEFEGSQFFGQELDNHVFWDWKPSRADPSPTSIFMA
jgi:hypothetical protein